MRRTQRDTKRYDYKVLATIGTTDQDQYPLLKEDVVNNDNQDIGQNVIASEAPQEDVQVNNESQDSVQNVIASEALQDVDDVAEGDDTVSALFANLTINSAVDSDNNSLYDTDEEIRVVEEITNDNQVADDISNTDQQLNALSDNGNVDVNANVSSSQSVPSSSSNEANITNSKVTMDINVLTVDEATVSEDIDDFLDENELCDVGEDPSEYDSLAQKAEAYRSSYRSLHNKLLTTMGSDAYEEKYKELYSTKLEKIKIYVKAVKGQKKKLKESDQNARIKSEKAKYDFLKKEFDSSFKELTEYLITDVNKWSGLSDEDISRRRECLNSKQKVIHSLADVVRELVGMATDDTVVKSINDNYQSLKKSKSEYEKMLNDVAKDRQLDQKQSFNRSKAQVDLPKFKGFSGMDIYTFQSKFEKINPASEIPKEHLL